MSETEDVVAENAAAADEHVYAADFQQLVLERSHDLITVADPAGRIVYASPSWTTLLGWDPDGLVGLLAIELVHPDDAKLAIEATARVARGEHLEAIPVRLRASDGRWVALESTGTPLRGPTGEVVYLLSTARDVGEREELRERVREVDALYRLADAIGRATSLDELLEEAIDTLLEATGADRAAVLLLDDDVMRFHAWRGLSDAYRAATEGHSPWPRGAIDAQPVLVDNVAVSDFEEDLIRVVRDEGIAALAFVPLVHGGGLLGKVMLYYDVPHGWTDREVRLASTIGNHLASATVRTRARAALQQSREQLETIMRTVDEGVVVQSQSRGLVYANDAAARLNGFASAEEMLAADREETLAQFEILDTEGKPFDIEQLPGRRALRGESAEETVRYRRRNTLEERWSVVRANPVHDADGNVVLAVSVIHDVTHLKKPEARVRLLARASELLNETLAVESTLGALADVVVPAFAGHVTVDLYDRDGVLRLVGARHVDPQKTDLMTRVRKQYPPTVPAHPVQRALATGEPQFVPDVQAQAESMAHDAEHARAIHELGNTSGIVVPLIARGRTFGAITFGSVPPRPEFTASDVELAVELGRRASAALDNALLYGEVEARAHAAQGLEFVDDGVFLVDSDDIIRLWNAAAAKTFDVRAAKAIGRPAGEVIKDWDTLRDRVRIESAPTAGVGHAAALPVEVQGSDRWLSISAVRFPGGTVYAFRDLTEERAVDQLKSDFVSTVSHELRTPLAAIYGAALTLQRDDVRLEESQRSGLLDVISSEADRLARIVNDILWASRLDSGQMGIAIESCDAAKLTRQVVTAIRSHAPSHVAIELEAAPGLPPVAADPDKLRQVLTNLIDNAVKYSPDGGHVRVALSRSGGRLRFRVQDEGLGIPPSEQSRIFEKFFRLDPNLTRGVGGTGLGLYICRELVLRMHGRIWVASDGRTGSTFTVELPLAG
jgi:PAS domain S-box-containing protein